MPNNDEPSASFTGIGSMAANDGLGGAYPGGNGGCPGIGPPGPNCPGPGATGYAPLGGGGPG
ncbi:hypothetical protein GCM10023197_02190 [Gordonia humi]